LLVEEGVVFCLLRHCLLHRHEAMIKAKLQTHFKLQTTILQRKKCFTTHYHHPSW
jgi:hypothetical protein